MLQRTFMEQVLGCAEQVQERLRSFRGEKPRAGTTRWQTEVLNQEFDATYRRNHRDIFNTLGNEYGWEFLEQVLQFHYLTL